MCGRWVYIWKMVFSCQHPPSQVTTVTGKHWQPDILIQCSTVRCQCSPVRLHVGSGCSLSPKKTGFLYNHVFGWLVRAKHKQRHFEGADKIALMLPELNWTSWTGFVLNLEKWQLEPIQPFQYLGARFDTVCGIVTTSDKYVARILQMLELSAREFTAQHLLSLICCPNFAAQLVELGHLYMRPIWMWF